MQTLKRGIITDAKRRRMECVMSDLRTSNSNAQTKKKKSFFHSNPVMNRLSKVDEVAADNEKAAGYGRIAGKTAYFLLFTVAGLLVYLLMNELLFKNQPAMVNLNLKGFRVVLSGIQIGFFVGASILAIVTQLVAFFARKAIPVVGAIYSFCQGFIISFLVFSILVGYEYLGLLALAITIVIVMVMAVLYSTRIIKASKKFHMVMISLFAGMIGISIFSFIGYLIPFTRPFVASILGNFPVSLLLTIISLLIATLFLISDFAMIEYVVENKMPAKYEWMAAFGLAFTVLWIYVKVLEILIRLLGNSKS